jgi:hypothetical protein
MQWLAVVLGGVFTLAGSLLAFWIESRRRAAETAERRSEFTRQRRIDACSRMVRDVEIASGELGALAGYAGREDDPSAIRLRSSTSVHDAWYSCRDFQLYFPWLDDDVESILADLIDKRDRVGRQLATGVHDADDLRAPTERIMAGLTAVRRRVTKELWLDEGRPPQLVSADE